MAVTLRQQGQLQRVIEICQQQWQLAKESGLSQTAVVGWLLAVWGEVLAELNDLEGAIDRAERGTELTERGELLLARHGLAAADEALACFVQALELGRTKGALGWELRTAMSLVDLWERRGEGCTAELAEARERLREVYGRFTDGFAFPDLQDAAALVGE